MPSKRLRKISFHFNSNHPEGVSFVIVRDEIPTAFDSAISGIEAHSQNVKARAKDFTRQEMLGYLAGLIAKYKNLNLPTGPVMTTERDVMALTVELGGMIMALTQLGFIKDEEHNGVGYEFLQ